MSKINLWWIIREHLNTLVDYRQNRISVGDVALFVVFPFVLGGGVAYFGLNLKTEVLNGLMAAFSIFAGLLLNLLVLVFSFTQSNTAQTSGPTKAYTAIRRTILREIHANISFSIVMALAMVVVVLISLWGLKYTEGAKPGATNWLETFLITVLASNFVLTLMMVLKRMYILISNEFDRPASKEPSDRVDLSA